MKEAKTLKDKDDQTQGKVSRSKDKKMSKTTLMVITKIFFSAMGIVIIIIDLGIRGRNVLSSHMNLVNNSILSM
jgi:hypothetical protein